MLLKNLRLGSRSVDVRVRDGIIVELGSLSGTGRDFGGAWISPGLWDHHVHFTQWVLNSNRVDLSAAASAVEAATMIAQSIESGSGDDGIVVGCGFRDGLWPDEPNRAVLDAATGGLPVVLVSGDLHSVWLNSAALVGFGHPGYPTGLLSEEDAFAVEQELGRLPTELVDRWARAGAARAAARGVVGVCDLEMAWNAEVWQRRIQAGHDALRVEFAIYTHDLDRAIAEGLRTGQRIDDLVTVGRYKVLSDGSLNTRTAYTWDDYDGGRGQLTVPPEVLLPNMRKSVAAGIVPTVHAIGDRANTLALDAFEELGCGGSIEHAQLLKQSDLGRFASLGVQASVQPEHAMDDRDMAEEFWRDRTARTYPFRSLLDAGAQLRFGSDAPVSPLDPWLAMSAAVDRTVGELAPWHPEQRISHVEALTASTRSTIAVGEPADMVVTEHDPLSARGDDLRRMPVLATLLGGRYTYGAE